MTRSTQLASVALFCAAAVIAESGCAWTRKAAAPAATPPDHTQLWQAPSDIAQRDLFHGPGGTEWVPQREPFNFAAIDKTGHSPGFDVTDAKGVEWSVKLGPEAQTEVVASRLLWAIGYHQPPTYYVAEWTLAGDGAGEHAGTQPAARFRPERDRMETVVGEWAWDDNPFIGTPQFGGLIVANLLINSWDWKRSNNKIYEWTATASAGDREGLPARRYVVRDLGASFGKTSYPTILKWFRLRGFGQGSRNVLADYEAQGFLLPSDDGDLKFDYRGIYNHVIDLVTPEDVRWTCELFSRLSDTQLDDAFRAAGYPEEVRARFVRKLKQKVQQGLEVRP